MPGEAFNHMSDHSDSHLYMMLRRVINEVYAEQPVDFNVAGLEAGQEVIGRQFTADDTVVDIGCNSGRMITEAAEQLGSPVKLVGVEPDPEAYEAYQRLPASLRNRLSFRQASGEILPLADSAVIGVSLHNVIFRAQNAQAMLSEITRIVKPGGFVAISSNAEGHAHYRHDFEAKVAHRVMQASGVRFNAPSPPAQGSYLQDLPALLQKADGLQIIATDDGDLYVEQKTRAIITIGKRLEDYLDSIKFSAANTDIPNHNRKDWRRTVESDVRPFIMAQMEQSGLIEVDPAIGPEPFFADPIHRGMFVLQKIAA